VSVSEASRLGRRLAWFSGDTVALALPLITTACGVVGLLIIGDQPRGHVQHLIMIISMALAMMSPFAIPLGRAIARATLWWHAPAAVLVALLVFLGLWCIAAAGMHLIGEILGLLITPVGAVAVITAWCVATQLGRGRRRVLATCSVTQPIHSDRHIPGATRWAGLATARCIRACAAPMTLTAVQPSLAGFAAVAILLWVERFANRPQFRLPLALAYLGIGIAMVLGMVHSGGWALGGHPGHH
jgi:hypothetical protein